MCLKKASKAKRNFNQFSVRNQQESDILKGLRQDM